MISFLLGFVIVVDEDVVDDDDIDDDLELRC
jgi:hypothetical protein